MMQSIFNVYKVTRGNGANMRMKKRATASQQNEYEDTSLTPRYGEGECCLWCAPFVKPYFHLCVRVWHWWCICFSLQQLLWFTFQTNGLMCFLICIVCFPCALTIRRKAFPPTYRVSVLSSKNRWYPGSVSVDPLQAKLKSNCPEKTVFTPHK